MEAEMAGAVIDINGDTIDEVPPETMMIDNPLHTTKGPRRQSSEIKCIAEVYNGHDVEERMSVSLDLNDGVNQLAVGRSEDNDVFVELDEDGGSDGDSEVVLRVL